MNWYNAIRGCKYNRIRMNLVDGRQPDCSQLTYDFWVRLNVACQMRRSLTYHLRHQIVGWLEKTGPSEREAWKRRWCCLGKRTLLYFSGEMEAFGKGEIWLGEGGGGDSGDGGASGGGNIWDVYKGPPRGFKKKTKGFLFTLVTPGRRYVRVDVLGLFPNFPAFPGSLSGFFPWTSQTFSNFLIFPGLSGLFPRLFS